MAKSARSILTLLLVIVAGCKAEIYYHDANGEMLQDDPYAAETYREGDPYLADWNQDWALRSGRLIMPKCVDIPANMSLCRNIGYTQMRLPNLLDHDTLREVTQQASSWNPLLGIQCHPDTQLFLCSLFSPVCLDRPIWPCRSLCESVKASCVDYLQRYGFPWPEMLRCDKFPLDNDLCIGLQNEAKPDDRICEPCNKPDTFESFVDSYCSSDFAVKLRIRENVISDGMSRLTSKKKTDPYKEGSLTSQELDQLTVYIENGAQCECPSLDRATNSDKFIVMGRRQSDKLIATYIALFDKDSNIQKRARRALRNDNLCTEGLRIMTDPDDPNSALHPPSTAGNDDDTWAAGNDDTWPAEPAETPDHHSTELDHHPDHQELPSTPAQSMTCAPCEGADTYETLMQHFCNSEFTVKVKLRETSVSEGMKLMRAKDRARTYNMGTLQRRDVYDMSLYIEDGARCECPVLDLATTKQVIVMGRRSTTNDKFIATYVQAFDKNSKDQRRALRAIRRDTACTGVTGGQAGQLDTPQANSASNNNNNQNASEGRKRKKNRKNRERSNRNRNEEREERRRLRQRERKNSRERKRRRQERQGANAGLLA